ncbi:uncharacterized protein CBL_11819 [Carabus blaptoides fortunei]
MTVFEDKEEQIRKYRVRGYRLNRGLRPIYFSFMSIIFINHFENPQQQSILEPQGLTQTSNIFTIILLSCSITGIIASLLLVYGLYRDQKLLLIPWIFTVAVFTMVDLVYCTYVFIGGTDFNPLTAILFTIDFFLSSLNVYALLCVISQYQEFKAGRGTAEDDQQNRIPSVHYSAPTTTTYLSTKRVITYHETRPTPTQSPTGAHTSLATEEPSPNPRPARKHVQFPDQEHNRTNLQNGTQMSEPWTIEVKSPMFRGIDTTPLIEPCVNPSQMHPQV